ncbi:MAG TPA: hypothetical protein VGM87_15295 [Roseomonas sp.]|jgi:hypothetical protein
MRQGPGAHWALVPAMIAAAGCTAGERMGEIQSGQSRAEVIRILGNPDGAASDGDVETLTYANRLMSGWSWDRATYLVRLTDGRVSAYGPVAIVLRGGTRGSATPARGRKGSAAP